MVDVNLGVELITKVAFLVLEALYIAFAIIVATQVNSLNKLFYIQPARSSRILQVLSILHILLAVFLFLLTLAIL